MAKKFKPGDKQLYEHVFDGLSYYEFPGEVYHLYRSKTKVQKFYLEAIKNIPTPKVLDIGCYIGTDLFMLPKSNDRAQYWGVDVSEGAIKYAKALAKQRGEKNINFKAIDANRPLPFPDSSFDVILALELIEHLHNPGSFMDEINRLLKPNGTVIISTPNEGRPSQKLIELFPSSLRNSYTVARESGFTRHGPGFHLNSNIWDHEAHISLHGYSDWKKLFETQGFKVEQVDGSSIFGGTRLIGDSPSLMGLTLIVDALVDKLPFKPYLQMCLIVKLRKSSYVS